MAQALTRRFNLLRPAVARCFAAKTAIPDEAKLAKMDAESRAQVYKKLGQEAPDDDCIRDIVIEKFQEVKKDHEKWVAAMKTSGPSKEVKQKAFEDVKAEIKRMGLPESYIGKIEAEVMKDGYKSSVGL